MVTATTERERERQREREREGERGTIDIVGTKDRFFRIKPAGQPLTAIVLDSPLL